jgi:preprotein translocase subunit YajC
VLASFWSAVWLLAQAEAGGAAKGGDPAAGSGGGILQLMMPFALIFMLFYFLIMRPEKRKQSDHKSLLEALKKNDRVVTIGGIYGVVANVQREADRVTIKVDEANNTKLDVTFNAIARVIVDEPAAEKKS